VSLLVSIHDATPALDAATRECWSICRRAGVRPALLVVPNWHGCAPLERDAGFARWLAERAAEGADILLHGERHDESGSARGWRDELRALGRTAGEGEFLTLRYEAASERIARGLRVLRDCGLDPVGFVPPAWLAREETHRACADLGLGVSEDERSLRVHSVGARLPSPVVRWSARTAVRAHASAAVARLRWHVQRSASMPRLALHPTDLDHPATRRSLERALHDWSAAHGVGSYRALAGAGALPAPAVPVG
jgi:predicted deacetylase